MSRKSHCIRPSNGQAVANSASKSLATPGLVLHQMLTKLRSVVDFSQNKVFKYIWNYKIFCYHDIQLSWLSFRIMFDDDGWVSENATNVTCCRYHQSLNVKTYITTNTHEVTDAYKALNTCLLNCWQACCIMRQHHTTLLTSQPHNRINVYSIQNLCYAVWFSNNTFTKSLKKACEYTFLLRSRRFSKNR